MLSYTFCVHKHGFMRLLQEFEFYLPPLCFTDANSNCVSRANFKAETPLERTCLYPFQQHLPQWQDMNHIVLNANFILAVHRNDE